MTGIILFIILAIGYALCGDPSGLEVIGKVILYIALFLIVGSIMAYVPVLGILILIVIIAIAYSSK